MNADFFPSDQAPDDEKAAWLARFNARDEKAFNDFFNVFSPSLNFFASRILLHYPEDAEEITNDCFMKVWISPAQFETIKHLKDYHYKTTRHDCFKSLKSKGLRQEALRAYAVLLGTFAEVPDTEKAISEIHREMYQLIASLPPNTSQAILLPTLEDLSLAETAAKLEISASNAAVLKHRGLKALREKLSRWLNGDNGPVLSCLFMLISCLS